MRVRVVVNYFGLQLCVGVCVLPNHLCMPSVIGMWLLVLHCTALIPHRKWLRNACWSGVNHCALHSTSLHIESVGAIVRMCCVTGRLRLGVGVSLSNAHERDLNTHAHTMCSCRRGHEH